MQDGGYHVSVAHPDLAQALDLKSYGHQIYERVSVQTAHTRPASSKAGSDRLGELPAMSLHVFRTWSLAPCSTGLQQFVIDVLPMPAPANCATSRLLHVSASWILRRTGMPADWCRPCTQPSAVPRTYCIAEQAPRQSPMHSCGRTSW